MAECRQPFCEKRSLARIDLGLRAALAFCTLDAAMYSLTPSMQTGIAQLDAEHQDLVMAINRIEEAERHGATPGVIMQLREFKEHLTEHFDSEERYLRMLHYPDADAHAKHHAETVTALDRMLQSVLDGEIEIGEIARECFHELLGTVITVDMRFLNWHAEHKRQAQ